MSLDRHSDRSPASTVPDDFLRHPIACPPHEEQEAIVDVPRRHTTDVVRRFIRNRRRLIGVLNEQKQAIINRAVTRGLDPNVPLKPSGIDWLGDIPEHWEAMPAETWSLRVRIGVRCLKTAILDGLSYAITTMSTDSAVATS